MTPNCNECGQPIRPITDDTKRDDLMVTMPFGRFLHLKCYQMRRHPEDNIKTRFLAFLIHCDDTLLKEVIEESLSDAIKRQVLDRYNIEMLERRIKNETDG